MRSTRLALAIVLGAVALSSSASAQRIELAGRVTASRTVLSQRRVGEARYLAISDLFYRDRSAYLELLDLAAPPDRAVIQIQARRAVFEKRFGVARGGSVGLPQGEIVRYRDGIVGIALAESAAAAMRHYWYVELDAHTGKLVRTADLAVIYDGEQLEIIGADAAGTSAWFAITKHTGRGRTVVLRRLDLDALGTRDVQRIALAPRAANHDREHAVRVHAAADFSRFAVVEYVEDGAKMAPGQVYIADPAAGGSFAVPAPPASYGVAFSADGKYVYLGSAQRGTIARVDVAARRIDKQVPGPRFLHHLVISPSGTKLFALASSSTYTVYDLPDLKVRRDAPHPAGVAAAMLELHGHGIASLDGAFFVAPDAEDPRKPAAPDRAYVIARLVE